MSEVCGILDFGVGIPIFYYKMSSFDLLYKVFNLWLLQFKVFPKTQMWTLHFIFHSLSKSVTNQNLPLQDINS